ncbi:hypothetical protein ACHAW5_002108 [Stephanodiscus triporus]|uniref:Uncharacterized protein n=1 Tax=Stephanodiscus triporus TaxID=2934178 RepID=A0ABD3MPE4_9STRA
MINYPLLLLSATLLLLLVSCGAHVVERRRHRQHHHPHPRHRRGHLGRSSFVIDRLPTHHRRHVGIPVPPNVVTTTTTTRLRPHVRLLGASLAGVVVASSSSSSSSSSYPSSVISASDSWGNIAALSFVASLAQLLGKTTTIGRLLGAPVSAMALSFALSSVDWIPRPSISPASSSSSSSSSSWALTTLLPPGGSPASASLQGLSLTLATPLLLLGTSVRGKALRRCGSLFVSFVVASFGTLFGAIAAMTIPHVRDGLSTSLTHRRDGAIIASALLAKNIGGGINYVAVCSCLGASSESVAAGLCVDNVMALFYFPLVSLLASKYGDCDDDDDDYDPDDDDVEVDHRDDGVGEGEGEGDDPSPPMEALSHAITLAAVLTALGRFLNSQLRHLPPSLLGGAARDGGSVSQQLDLSLPITTLLAVLFSTYYPPDLFLSPTTARSRKKIRVDRRKGGGGDDDDNTGNNDNNNIARAGQTLGTSLLYLFFATAGAPGWRLKDSIQKSFPSIASFLVILYGVHGCVLLGARWLITRATAASAMEGKIHPEDNDADDDGRRTSFWKKVVAPQRLLVSSSAAIGGPATAAALAKSFRWESLLTPSLLVGNVGYAVATFIGLLFYSVYR